MGKLIQALRSAHAAFIGSWKGVAVARAPLRFAVCTDNGTQAKKAFEGAVGGSSRVEFWDGAVRRSIYEKA